MKKFLTVAGFFLSLVANAQDDISLSSKQLSVKWTKQSDGWHIQRIDVNGKPLEKPTGYYTILYLNRRPAGNLVDIDIEGKDFSFYPSNVTKNNDGSLTFTHSLRVADVEAIWSIDPAWPTDLHVQLKVKTKVKGSFSVASPSLAAIDPNQLDWGMIPGNWYGRELEKDFQLSTRYSMGVPATPFLAKERNTMTLSAQVSTKNKLTLAVIPDPGTAADCWTADSNTKHQNKLGLSLINRHNELSPVAYAPVMGQQGSNVQAGTVLPLSVRYSVQAADWFPVFRHAVLDVYRYTDLLQVQKNKRSLSQRVNLMHTYLNNDKKSNWSVWKSNGFEIGANGMKNADIGAMWMMALAGRDTIMQRKLPYVRNYKLAQQDTLDGFFQGAALGEYADEDGVESERGNYIEPLFTTYYTLMDMGNMLLHQPNDPLLKKRVQLAADKLIAWQHDDGGWDVAYDRFSHQSTFPDLKDVRPTWYGLLIAYRVLGDERYLQAAKNGANWLIKNGVDKGHYLGVCGDARNVWDFATAQCSQAFLDLYTITKDEIYKQAGIEAAKIYATSIFTQPIATDAMKSVAGTPRHDWEITQTGLSVEHIRGTAGSGPILISSFAGLFVRIFELTKDSLFLYMSRGAARGRDAFVDENGQSIYYWNGVEKVAQSAKLFPHHAYWQVGWITDYLLSEAHLRSGGKVSFTAGFMTPKVGPHVSYGFAPGEVYGTKANLVMPVGLVTAANQDMEYITAVSTTNDKLFLIVLNQATTEQSGSFTLDLSKLLPGKKHKQFNVKIPAWGINVTTINLK